MTSAAVHDSQALESLITEKDFNHEMYADSAYSGQPIKDILKEKNIKKPYS